MSPFVSKRSANTLQRTIRPAIYPTAQSRQSTIVSVIGLYENATSMLGIKANADSVSITNIRTNAKTVKPKKNGVTLPFHRFLTTINITRNTETAKNPPACNINVIPEGNV